MYTALNALEEEWDRKEYKIVSFHPDILGGKPAW